MNQATSLLNLLLGLEVDTILGKFYEDETEFTMEDIEQALFRGPLGPMIDTVDIEGLRDVTQRASEAEESEYDIAVQPDGQHFRVFQMPGRPSKRQEAEEETEEELLPWGEDYKIEGYVEDWDSLFLPVFPTEQEIDAVEYALLNVMGTLDTVFKHGSTSSGYWGEILSRVYREVEKLHMFISTSR